MPRATRAIPKTKLKNKKDKKLAQDIIDRRSSVHGFILKRISRFQVFQRRGNQAIVDKVDELVQETLLYSIRNMANYDPKKYKGEKDPLAHWLIWRARSVMMHDFKSRRCASKNEDVLESLTPAMIRKLRGEKHDVDGPRLVYISQIRERLRRAVKIYCTETEQKVFESRFVLGHEREESAEYLGMQVSTVSTHTSSLIKRLKECVKEHQFE